MCTGGTGCCCLPTPWLWFAAQQEQQLERARDLAEDDEDWRRWQLEPVGARTRQSSRKDTGMLL